ncbi:MAG TPA: hypothetical protein VLG17_19615 [Pseudomonas sp.]|uniref:hypothetical protein n=1 Tax=Pseudomonas sp. TaxID=306 RepID=UPI002BECD0AD|nr:hypothetical protein [Pseudomonas sp.]HSX90190.1 hypothetical protein [Pseudomonas sp.]
MNHKFAAFQRYILGLRGKSNNLPNPFAGTHHMEGDESKKVQLRLGGDRKPAPYTVTSVNYEEFAGEGGGTMVSIMLDASDERKLDGILNKIAKKLKVSREQFDGIDYAVQSIEHPSIHCRLTIDLAEFKIGLLKIAYEFAVDTVPQYFEDSDAIDISRILRSADYGSVDKYVNIGNGFDHGLFASLRDYLDLESKKHYLVLASGLNGGLTCLIHLHGMFSVGVCLSEGDYPDDLIVIGVNDLEARTFRKVFSTDIVSEVYGPPVLRLQYYFRDESDLGEFLDVQARDDFSVMSTCDCTPIFDRAGSKLQIDLHGKMKEVENEAVGESLEGGGIAHVFPIHDEVFVKILPVHKLVQVVAVREERQQVKKL